MYFGMQHGVNSTFTAYQRRRKEERGTYRSLSEANRANRKKLGAGTVAAAQFQKDSEGSTTCSAKSASTAAKPASSTAPASNAQPPAPPELKHPQPAPAQGSDKAAASSDAKGDSQEGRRARSAGWGSGGRGMDASLPVLNRLRVPPCPINRTIPSGMVQNGLLEPNPEMIDRMRVVDFYGHQHTKDFVAWA